MILRYLNRLGVGLLKQSLGSSLGSCFHIRRSYSKESYVVIMLGKGPFEQTVCVKMLAGMTRPGEKLLAGVRYQ